LGDNKISATEIKTGSETLELRIYRIRGIKDERKKMWIGIYNFDKPQTIIDVLEFLNSKCDNEGILQGYIAYMKKIELERTMREECLSSLSGIE
jgi:hypothetical protein